MSKSLWSIRLALAGAIALTGGACVLGDLFGSDGLKQEVSLDYVGPGNMRLNEQTAFCVTVRVGDDVVRNARVSVLLSNDTVVAFTPRKDSLIALRDGMVDLTARLESAMLVDTVLTVTKQIKVQNQVCGPTPPCDQGAPCASAPPL